MTLVRFIARDGSISSVDAPAGSRLLDVAQANGQPLEGTCEGEMACATCHVVIDPADFALLPPAAAEEEELLDLAYAATRTSRLACQVFLAPGLGAITVRIPA